MIKSKLTILFFVSFILLGLTAQAQFNPFSNNQVMINAGIGFSGYGIPLYVSADFPIADNITVGGGISYQSDTETIGGLGSAFKWKHTIFGIGARGDYHFNELMGMPDEWDFYAGASIEYFSWKTKLKEGSGVVGTYVGSGSGGLGVSGRVGIRYFFNDKLAANAELGGGSVLSSGRIGVTLLL